MLLSLRYRLCARRLIFWLKTMRTDFEAAMVNELQVDKKSYRKFMVALETVLRDQLKNSNKAAIPRVCILKRVVKPAVEERVKNMFGKEMKLKARPEKVTYRASVAKRFRDAV